MREETVATAAFYLGSVPQKATGGREAVCCSLSPGKCTTEGLKPPTGGTETVRARKLKRKWFDCSLPPGKCTTEGLKPPTGGRETV